MALPPVNRNELESSVVELKLALAASSISFDNLQQVKRKLDLDLGGLARLWGERPDIDLRVGTPLSAGLETLPTQLDEAGPVFD